MLASFSAGASDLLSLIGQSSKLLSKGINWLFSMVQSLA